MIDWLLQRFIQEIPEEISVCEFDCPMTNCTANVWTECELRHQGMLSGGNSSIIQADTRDICAEIPVSVFTTN